MVIVGDVDRLTPPPAVQAMAQRLPDGTVVVLDGAGHCAMLERHAEFNHAVEGFLDEHLPLVPRAGQAGRAAAPARARASRSS
jgi:hypothetical protein